MSQQAKISRPKAILQQLAELAKMLIPNKRDEIILFVILMLVYSAFGLYILFTSSVLDSQEWIVDAYFGFDNSAIYLRGYTNIPRHPLLTIISKPLMVLGDILQSGIHPKGKAILFILACNLCVSLAIVYVYRYIKNIVKIDKRVCYLLTAFFALTPSCIILSFTSDTFTPSLFILSFIVFYYSYFIKENKEVPLISSILLSVTTGGITITNISKSIVPIFFTKGGFKKHIKEAIVVGIAFFLVLLAIDMKYGVFTHLFIQAGSPMPPEMADVDHLRYILDGFWGSPVLLPEMTTLHQHFGLDSSIDLYKKNISPSFYTSYLYFIPLIIFYGLIIYSVIRNYKNKFVWMLLFIFAFDIIIHLVLKFGINETFIYAGHWIYVFPLILAWGVKKMNERQTNIFMVVFGILTIGMLISNISELGKFIHLVQELYPPIM